ncbi:von Willebrand factor D and EGF domain-containing protein-like [Mytilus galloprovincialis]|uniref:von Willebrand factor D and EGF domain-containing protein-like n=1 Tax=Mytilus galloprovincialis TaxID=29158 RepID=UPI003F7C8802
MTSTENIYVDLNITDYIYWLYASPTIPTYDLNSEDHQLMFECYVYSGYYYYNSYDSLLNSMTYDIQWYIDNEEFITKTDIAYDNIHTDGRLKSTDWMHREKKIGINIKCGIRFHLSSNKAFMESWNYYAGLDMWPNYLSISSGESATLYVWTTVPIACRYNDTSYSCKVKLDLFDFNEQFTAGAPMYCNNSVTEMTKPSMCGLELDGWQQWAWQTLDINLPENSASDQEYQAKVKLRVLEADDDPIWSNYQLPEVTVHVVNDNVTDDYWWWYGWCFTGTDPWFSTFDWQSYDFHDQGEFVLYRHKTKPIEVHTIQRRYEKDHTWTEHCAIAVRAASDVFIIYGCGKPTKWIIRRLNCGIGNEYLEVYSRWGGYEIALPTGSRVYVWISLNRRINAYISMSRTDRYQTEGLCGTWNRDYEDDFTGRDGVVYDNATTFARTWRVPANDSLFMEKERTEKLSQSFMYCSCMNSTQDGLSPNVDCSWKETMPTCPPLNWGREPCSIRSKRSADDDDDVTIDVSPDIVAYIKEPVVDPGWKNDWNESAADDACNSYFSESILFDACSSISNVNASSAISNCIVNIRIAGTDEYMADSFELFKTQCINEVRTNNSLYSEMSANGTSIAQLITENDCPFECKYNGVKNGDCVEGFCNCYVGFTGEDCRVNMTAPPVLATEMSNDSLCDTGIRACNYISVFGENFYISNDIKCRIENAEIIDNKITSTGSYIFTTAIMENMGEIRCSTTANRRRRKRSTTSTSGINVYLVSVTNNGVEFSDSVPVVMFDSSCNTCTTTDTYVFCQLRSDVCVLNGACYVESSSQCNVSSDTTDSDTFKLWIIGVVISVLLVLIIFILVIKWCGNKKRPVSPMEYYADEQADIYFNQNSAFGNGESSVPNRKFLPKPVKINVKPW